MRISKSTGLVLAMVVPCLALEFFAYGDTRTNKSDHQKVIDAMQKGNPELILHTGDLWDGYSSGDWRKILESSSKVKALLHANRFLVARGNHESESSVKNFSPSIVKNGNIRYTHTQGTTFFVSMGYDPGQNLSWLETQLKSDAAKDAKWRVVWAHKPVYSTGSHGASGVGGFEDLCDKYNVTAFFAGHDHHYERSYQIKNGSVTTKSSSVIDGEGTVYLVAGGGGAPLRSVGDKWWTASAKKTLHYCKINATDTEFRITAVLTSGSKLDEVTIAKKVVSTVGEACLLSRSTPQTPICVTRAGNTTTVRFRDGGTIRWAEFYTAAGRTVHKVMDLTPNQAVTVPGVPGALFCRLRFYDGEEASIQIGGANR